MMTTVISLLISAIMSRKEESMNNKDVGKIIYARGRGKKGTITNMTDRWCAGCGRHRYVYSVKWEDGRRTFPCPAGCKDNPDGSIEIL